MSLDKFYTIPDISQKCITTVGDKYDWNTWDLVIEPGAGNGSFFLHIPTSNRIGIDIAPEHPDIVQHDFLTYTPPIFASPRTNSPQILVIGNPPFGKVSSVAVKFFNHAASFSATKVIAFILPKTFRRISVQNKLNKYFHLVYDEDIPMHPCSFTPPMMAKCCFQIWEKVADAANVRVPVQLAVHHHDWEFVAFGPIDARGQPTPPGPSDADFAIRAYGGKCGEIISEPVAIAALRPKSWHWIKSNIHIPTLIDTFHNLDYSISMNTSRQNSIGRGELVMLYTNFAEQHKIKK